MWSCRSTIAGTSSYSSVIAPVPSSVKSWPPHFGQTLWSSRTLCSILRVTSWRFFSAFSRRVCSAASRSASASGIADRLREGRHLLGPLAEDVSLELLDGRLHRGELLGQLREQLTLLLDGLGLLGDGFLRSSERSGRGVELRREALGLVAPFAAVIAAPHQRVSDHVEGALSMGREASRSAWDGGVQCCGRRDGGYRHFTTAPARSRP
jgi:hypothetical protein